MSNLLAAETGLLFANVNTAIGVTTVAATVLGLLQWQVVSHTVIASWWIYVIAVSLGRVILARQYAAFVQIGAPPEHASRWASVFATLAGFAGIGWGAAGVVLYAPDHLANQVFLVFVLGGMMLGAVTLLAPRPEAYLSFLIPAGFAPALRLLYVGDETHIAMGLLAVVFTLAMVRTTGAIHRTIASSLQLQFENHDLITELQVASERSETLNQQLERRVLERTAELHQSNERLRAEIVQREKTEEELLRARKLESLGVLAGGIAHDFNNFLTIVSGNVELLRMELTSNSYIDELLEQISTACRRATFLSSQLLTFAKGGAPVRRVVSLRSLIMDAIQLARAGTSLSFEVNIADNLWNAEVDPGQISQVLHNILINGRQAMPEGGILEVLAENGPNTDLNLRPTVRISLRDYGCGIAPEILPKIFDPYFTTKSSGSGLGLATSYAIVAKHGGHISVESVLGHGTVFTIELPASPDQEKLETHVSQPPAEQLTGRVLVMDDEAPIRRLLKIALTRLGYQVQTAADGAEAVALYEEAKAARQLFHLVFLDVTVSSGMGGLEAAARLREIDPDVKLIVSSGYSSAPVMADYRSFGFDGMLAKPWSAAELREAVRSILVNNPDRKAR